MKVSRRRRQTVGQRAGFAARLSVLCGLTTMSVVTGAQVPTLLTESRAREFVRQAARQAKGDSTDLVLDLDHRVREAVGDFESFPLSIVRSEDLLVTVTGPFIAFRRSVIDFLRTGRPADRAPWTGAVVVEVTPRRISAPDIATVELTRNGHAVAATRSTLRPMAFSDGAGREAQLHAGEVHFAPEALLPDADVRLTLAVPDHPIVHRFSEAELRGLK